ncbi:MAG TPA: glycine betaine ABC transporter substrate-binding protein, partial [Ktedonobacterales bacterium]|nr:glycine betaine ABC transporter substrate-binding protein [Ktedonobacterales bacterium]
MARLESTGMRVVLRAAAYAGLAALASSGALASPDTPGATAPLAEPAACRIVRLSDIGWTDVTTTTAVFGALLRHLGYQPEITVLSVPVTFASMKNKDIDVFLGNWMPAEEGDRKSFVEEGSV